MGLQKGGSEEDAQISGLGNWMDNDDTFHQERKSNRFEERHEERMSSVLDTLYLEYP